MEPKYSARFLQSTRWYDWETGVERPSGASYIDAPIDFVPVFQRGGTIVPTWQRIRRAASLMIQVGDILCVSTRKTLHCVSMQDPLTLFVALDRSGNAKGRAYLDDGATFDYKKGVFVSVEMEYR